MCWGICSALRVPPDLFQHFSITISCLSYTCPMGWGSQAAAEGWGRGAHPGTAAQHLSTAPSLQSAQGSSPSLFCTKTACAHRHTSAPCFFPSASTKGCFPSPSSLRPGQFMRKCGNQHFVSLSLTVLLGLLMYGSSALLKSRLASKWP